MSPTYPSSIASVEAPPSRRSNAVLAGAVELAPAGREREVDPEQSIGLRWIWRLRWGALAGQIAALAVARFALDIRLPYPALGLFLGLLAISNVALGRWLSRRELARDVLALIVLFDVFLLTALLFFSGGAANPFSAFYVVYVAIAALLLGRNWAAASVALTSLAFGALFGVPAEWLGPHAHHVASPLHLRGMWTAYALSAGFVAYFVSKVASALRERERRLRDLERYAAAVERVASLSTMAAGAAHELATPLATIAVSATELAEALEQQQSSSPLAQEARHIREEVSRCRGIIDRLAAGAGEHSGEALEWVSLDRIAGGLLDEIGAAASLVRVEIEGSREHPVRCPPRALTQVLANLVRNGLDAARAAGSADPIELFIRALPEGVRFSVGDRGPGLSELARAHVGEPFFTTKKPGEGMGLGLYLVRAFARDLGAEFRLESRPGGGTLALLTLKSDALRDGGFDAG